LAQRFAQPLQNTSANSFTAQPFNPEVVVTPKVYQAVDRPEDLQPDKI